MRQDFGYLRVRRLVVLFGGLLAAGPVLAQQMPSGLQVVAGSAALHQNGAQLTVTNSNNAILNWNSFSIGAGNSVNFVQPGSTSQVLNRVVGNDPSSILGNLSSNGRVWLLNPNGVLFGANSRVDVAGLVTSTLNLSNSDWLAGRYRFEAGSTMAGIDNQGRLRSTLGGQVALIGGSVSNEGVIEAAGGQITLAAGQSVELIDTGAPNLAVKVSAPSGSALNLGDLKAGLIDVIAAAVNQQGLVQAESLSAGPAGEIILQAGDRLTVASGSNTRADGAVGGNIKLLGNEIDLQNGSTISANGSAGGGSILVGGGAEGKDSSVPNAQAVYVAPQASLSVDALSQGDGGHIVVWSDVATRAFGRFSARGGSEGGNGGLIETSGHWLDARPSALDVSAPRGNSGTWLLDPYDITIDNTPPDTNVNSAFTATGSPAHLSTSTIISVLNAGANVTVSTGTGGNESGTITLSGATISPNTGLAIPHAETLSFLASGDIKVINNSVISDSISCDCSSLPPPLSVIMRSGSGGIGAISVVGSTIGVGGNITLGGFGPNNAAIGHTGMPDGVYIDSSTIVANGTVAITGQTAVDGGRGDWINVPSSGSPTNFFVGGGKLVIKGVSTGLAGTGVEIDSGSLGASLSLSISGTGTGTGLALLSDGSLKLEQYGGASPQTLTGTSTGGGYGVLIDNSAETSTSAPLFQSVNVGLTITGTNAASSAVPAVNLIGNSVTDFFGKAYGTTAGDFNVSAVGAGLSMTNVSTPLQNIESRNGVNNITLSSSSSLLINNGYLDAAGTIALQGKQVSLAGSAVLAPDSIGSPAANATALTVSGPGGTGPADSFNNQAGEGAIFLPYPYPNSSRWIIWLNDATVPANLDLGGLSYDFQRYGAKTSAAWANDYGNGVVSYVNKTLTLTGDVASKTYDGTTATTVSNVVATPEVSGDIAQDCSGDCFNPYFGNTGSFVDPNAGSGKLVVLTGGYTSFSPNSLSVVDSNQRPVYGYTFVNDLRGTIYRAVLHADVTGTNKIYDGTTNDTINITNVTGLIGNQTVATTGVGSFLDKNVGQNKPVNVSYSLGNGTNGGLGSNYVLLPNGPVTASITPATLDFTATGGSRIYDGTTNAMALISNITGLVGGETVAITGSGSFADPNVGQAKPFTATYTFAGSNGWLASNYQFRTSDVLAGNITPAPLSFVASGGSRIYDGTTAATVTVTGINGLVAGESVTVTGTGSFVDKNVGQNKPINVSYTVGSGANGWLASNYQFSTSGLATGNITPATLTYMATPVAVLVGATLPALNGSVTGFIGGESLATATTGNLSFAAGVADTSVAGVYAINGQGLAAANYDFVQALGNAVALKIDAGLPNAPDGPLVQTQTSAVPPRSVGPAPIPRPDPRTSGLLDLTPKAPASPPQGVGPAAVANFDSVPVDTMSPLALADLLSARESLMDRVLKEGLDKLRKDPTLADVAPCQSLKDALLGTCLVTEAMKAQFSSARVKQLGAPGQAGATPPPKPGVVESAGVPPPLPPPLFSAAKVKNAALPEIRRKVAVLIGEGRYSDTKIPGLANTVGDAHAVASTLTEQLGYETLVLDNPSKEELIAILNRLALEIGPEDSAIVYYAGHGAVVEETGAGYWLAASSQAEDPRTWLSNADIARLIEQVGARQVVLISDSCYSGSLVAGARIRGAPGELNPTDVLARRSAVVMSSGGNEPVFDSGRDGHSLFAWSLMNTLSQVKSWRPGGNLFERIRFTVARELPQRPQYGAAPGYQEGGDYLFEVRELDKQTSGGRAPG